VFINPAAICAINDRNRGFCQLKGGKEKMYEMLPEAVPDLLHMSLETPALGLELEEGSTWVSAIPEGVLGLYGRGGREYLRW
jgi:hypothetical protein